MSTMSTDFPYPHLEGCPFCNGEARLRQTAEHYDADANSVRGSFTCGYTIGCDDCGFEMADEYLEEVVTRWNTRKGERFDSPKPALGGIILPNPVLWVEGANESLRTRTAFGHIAIFKLSDGRAACQPFWSDSIIEGTLDDVRHIVEEQFKDRLTASMQTGGFGTIATHRHLKSGGLYRFVAFGKMQAEHWFDTDQADNAFVCGKSVDMRDVVIYQKMKDHTVWARPVEEFQARFRQIK